LFFSVTIWHSLPSLLSPSDAREDF
jgi:hypothetical protein